MKILVAVTDYSKPNQKDTHFFVQVRNLYYKEHGIDVCVLNFSAKTDYEVNGLKVFSLESYKTTLRNEKFDILVCHAPNIRNHYKFLIAYGNDFPKFVFFFHGHEVLNTRKVYSKPYPYVKDNSLVAKVSQDLYDHLKLYLWRRYFTKCAHKSFFIFVSNWMRNEFFKWTQIKKKVLLNRTHICYNSIGKIFEEQRYKLDVKKEYDFITIRSNIDGSKYSIDLVNSLAWNNPSLRFCVIGRGDFFSYNEKAPNLEWKDTLLNHYEIIEYLNLSRCALMPTRTDAQGLMMCEMASFGIPVITSDIPVCSEVFAGFENVFFIKNQDFDAKLNVFLKNINRNILDYQNSKYYSTNTVAREVELFELLIRS